MTGGWRPSAHLRGASIAPASSSRPCSRLLAAVLLWDASGLQSGAMYGVGPSAMPIVVAVGLALLSIGNLIDALRGNLPPRESADPKARVPDPRRACGV